MSDHDDPIIPPTPPPPGRGQFSPGWRQRAKSINLREQDADHDPESMMDPATQSLSDALRITYRIVHVAVLALIVLYALSGFRTVAEGESGMRLLFGRIQEKDIAPGFRFSWPEPLGELVKVRTGIQEIIIDDDFFPELTPEEKNAIIEKGTSGLTDGGRDKLDPELDGSNVTGDGNIGHTRWAIRYHRQDVEQFVSNIDPDSERALVRGAVKQGIVHASAVVSIDELFKGQKDAARAGGEFRMDVIAAKVAQQTLDSLNSGIVLDVVSITERIPPRRTMRWFTIVDTSYTQRQNMREEALSRENEILTDTAGEAWRDILRQIDRYEAALATKDDAAAGQTLATIDDLLAGRPTRIDGREVSYRVYGKVTNVVNEAISEKTRLINSLKGQTASFQAKRELFSNNRRVFLNNEWTDAYAAFISRPTVQQLILPQMGPAGRMVMTLGVDPEVANRIIRDLNRRKAEEAEELKKKEAERLRFERRHEPTNTVEH
ncbi:MAG: hypothetical protein AB7G11_10085 [Phycisphaerales bacterium]